jgi:Thrombospondin type 3 repeat
MSLLRLFIAPAILVGLLLLNGDGGTEAYNAPLGSRERSNDAQEGGVTLVGPQQVNVLELPTPPDDGLEEPNEVNSPLSEGPPGPGGPPAQANVVDSPSSPPMISGAAFEGLDVNNDAALTAFRPEPPDPQMAVGPNHVMEMVNFVGRIYTRTGSVAHTFVLKDFFLGAIGPYAVDPKLLYDDLSDRWFAIALSFVDNPPGQPDQGQLHIAVSMTSSPLGWNIYHIDYENVFPDYPGIGVTNDKVTISSNLWTISPQTFVGEQTLVLEKADLVSGVGSAPFAFPTRTDRQTTRPAQSLSATNDQYLVTRHRVSGNPCHPSFETMLMVIRITGTPASGNVTEASAADLTTLPQTSPPLNMLQLGFSGPNEPFIDSRATCKMLDAVWRDGRLWTSATTGCTHAGDPAPRACAHLIEVNTGTTAISQDMIFGAPGDYYIYPAVRTDASGDLYVSLSRSNGNIYPESRVAGRRLSDPPNSLSSSALMRAGDWPYCPNTCQRWGDYLGAAVDPNFPECVWAVSEYGKNTGIQVRNWGTHIASTSYSGGCDGDNDSFIDANDNCPLVANASQANNVHDATTLGDACEDPDMDEDFDIADNCPDWHNPSQTLPPWNVPLNDLDCDGFSVTVENPVGTSASVHCGVDAWPPDFDNNGSVGVIDDLGAVAGFAFKSVPEEAPARYDIAPDPPDGVIDVIGDISRVAGLAFKNCGTPDGYYHPLTPARIVDTRIGLGLPGMLGHNSTATVDVTGVGGVPAAGVMAVVVNATVTQPTAPSYLTVYPSGAARPPTSNLNFVAGQTVANLVTVGVGADGNITVFNVSGQTHLILDIAGWYGGPSGGSRYNPLTPARILDTRNGTGAPAGKISPNTNLVVDVTDTESSGVPASGVTAVALSTTVAEPTAQGVLTVYPSDAPLPSTSNLTFLAGQTVSNLVVVKVGVGGAADGKVNVYNGSAGSTDVIFDVVGWYGGIGDVFHLVTPSRALDTRFGPPFPPLGKVGANSETLVDVTGTGSLPAGGASSVVVNTTVTQPTANSFLTVWPSSEPRPQPASNLSFAAGQIVANLVVAKVGVVDGNVKVYNSAGQTHVIMDAAGYFGP